MANLLTLEKSLNKSGITTGIIEPDHWLSTGIHLLNHTMTGTFSQAIPNRRSVLFWGESGTGKSFILSLIALAAQKDGYQVIYIDTETAIHEEYLEKIGVDIKDPQKFLATSISTVSQATKTMSDIYKTISPDDKICVILDSLSNLETDTDSDNFDKGIAKGDQGQLAKQLKKFMKSVNAKLGQYDMHFITSGHAYLNQDIKNGEGKWLFTGGKGVQFIPSIGVLLTKLKLKEDTDIVGIKLKTEITKSRFSKLGGKTEIELDYEKGFEAWAGMLDIAIEMGMVTQAGAWYTWTKTDGSIQKFQRKNFGKYFYEMFDISDVGRLIEEKFDVEVLEVDAK